jgi:hypothetical protein
MAMKKTSGGDSPLRQGAGKSFWTLPIEKIAKTTFEVRVSKKHHFSEKFQKTTSSPSNCRKKH